MRRCWATPSVAVAAAMLAGCTGIANDSATSISSYVTGAQRAAFGAAGFRGVPLTTVPKEFLPTHLDPTQQDRPAPPAAKGIYVSAILSVQLWGFPKNNRGNGFPTCTVNVLGDVNGFGVDNSGNLIVPDGFAGIAVYGNSSMCGPLLGTISDPYGQAADASAIDAANGTIAIANIMDNSGQPGSISLCTLASGTCSTNLTNASMSKVAGVALSSNGDCWANALNSSRVAVLVWFQGCSGPGVVASGYSNGYYGGVEVDGKGYLVTTSLFGSGLTLPSEVSVYSGCNPACTLISSSNLAGESILGHVGIENERYVTTDLKTSSVEVYYYRPSGLSFRYSFDAGLPCATDTCEDAAYSPSTQK